MKMRYLENEFAEGTNIIMRIIVNNIAASIGGTLSILEDFYSYIKDNDIENEWVFLLGGSYIKETKNIKVKVLKEIKNNKLKKMMFDFVWGKHYIEKLKPDIVFSMQNIITFGIKTPQIVYIHQAIPFQNVKKFSMFKSEERAIAIYQYIIGGIIKLSAKKSNKVIVQTDWMKNAVIEKTKISSKKIVSITPNMANMGKINLMTHSNEKQFFYPTSDIIYKNNECIYKSCEILNRKGYNDFEVKLTIKDKGQKNNIQFVNRISREQVLEEYTKAVVIFPSYIESCALPLIEARRVGTIVLASDCPLSKEVLKGYENAYFFDPFKPEELSELMEQVIDERITRKKVDTKIKESDAWKEVIKVIKEF